MRRRTHRRGPIRPGTLLVLGALLGGLTVGPAVLAPGRLPAAEAAVASSCGPVLPVYGVSASGALDEWLDQGPAASGGLAAVSAPVANGWAGNRQVLTAGAGVFYTVSADGILRWWRHTGTTTGAATWATGSGVQVGHGWQVFTKVVSLGGGVLYGVLPDGRLLWYRHQGVLTGTGGWAAGSGSTVGRNWSGFSRLLPGGYGSMYAITPDGGLYWYAHDGWQTGRAAWAAASGTRVGHGWSGFTAVFSGSGGILYGLLADGTLRWYDHSGAVTGSGTWLTGSVTGVDLRGHTFLAGDPTVCTGLDRSDTTAVRRVSSGIVAGAGWSSTEFGCLSDIAIHESSWRWNAGVPTGSYGIPQATPGTKMSSVASDWQGNPVTQVRWMLAYLVAHYGSPCKGWAFWQAHGYY